MKEIVRVNDFYVHKEMKKLVRVNDFASTKNSKCERNMK